MSASMRQGADLIDVRLLGFPVALHAASEEHHDELLREFAHIANAPSDSGRVPARLVALVTDLRQRYAHFSGPAREHIDTARMQGRSSIDLVYRMPPSVGPAALELAALLDEADEFCREGHLLTLATDQDMVQFRRWLLEEFARQSDGAEPQPWPASTGQTAT